MMGFSDYQRAIRASFNETRQRHLALDPSLKSRITPHLRASYISWSASELLWNHATADYMGRAKSAGESARARTRHIFWAEMKRVFPESVGNHQISIAILEFLNESLKPYIEAEFQKRYKRISGGHQFTGEFYL